MLRKRPRKSDVARLVLDPHEPTHDEPLLRSDADMLWDQGKLQKLEPSPTGYSRFCPPRSWRQICHDVMPSPHPDVLALVAKARNAGAKL